MPFFPLLPSSLFYSADVICSAVRLELCCHLLCCGSTVSSAGGSSRASSSSSSSSSSRAQCSTLCHGNAPSSPDSSQPPLTLTSFLRSDQSTTPPLLTNCYKKESTHNRLAPVVPKFTPALIWCVQTNIFYNRFLTNFGGCTKIYIHKIAFYV